MVGGKKEHLDTCLPVLEAMGSRVEHMGGWGAGAAAKLVNQVLRGYIQQYISSIKVSVLFVSFCTYFIPTEQVAPQQ